MHQGTQRADEIACSIGALDDPVKRLTDLLEIRRLGVQQAQRRLGIDDRRGDRLVDFMGNRSREVLHRRDAVGVRQFDLCFDL